jgi:phosphate transport system substrate-binding protein
MHRWFPILSISLALAVALDALPARADELRVGGTGEATALLVYLGKPFTQQTGIAVDVIPGLGSGGGISAAADGVIDIAVSGRKLSAGELARSMVQVMTMRTPYVFATSRREAVGMTEREIVGAFTAVNPTWPNGSPLRLILRPRAESDNQVLMSSFPGMAEALDQARQRPDLPIAATDQDNADMAEALEGSLISTTYTQLIMEARRLRPIAIGGVPPTIETFESGAYRYAKVFYVVFQRTPSAAALRFAQFLSSEEGARALREAGCLPGTE